MKTQQFLIGQIPAVLYGEHAERLWLFLHGQMGYKEEAEVFAKIVCPKGAQVLGIDLPGHGNDHRQRMRAFFQVSVIIPRPGLWS